MNTFKVIKNDQDHQAALARLDALMEAAPGSPEAEELDLLSCLVDKYESEVFPVELPDPVEAIKFRMEQQGLTRKELVACIGSQSKVSEVLNRKRPLSLSMIRALHTRLGIPAEVLLQQPGRKLKEARYNPDDYPFREMFTAGYFRGVDSLKKVKEQAEELLGQLLSPLESSPAQVVLCRNSRYAVGSSTAIADGKADYPSAVDENAIKHKDQNEASARAMDTHALRAWQARALQLCAEQKIPRYKHGVITEDFIRRVINLGVFPNGPRLAEQALRDSGIHFILLPHLPRTFLDGACFNAPDGRPVIGMTLRHDRLDNFWFTLAHELAHAILHLAKNNFAFFDDTEHAPQHDCSQHEKEANDLSSRLLIPRETWEAYQPALTATLDEYRIVELAEELDISPAIIAGRLRWETNNYSIFNELLGAGSLKKLFKEVNGRYA